jgi:hypothetical protein
MITTNKKFYVLSFKLLNAQFSKYTGRAARALSATTPCVVSSILLVVPATHGEAGAIKMPGAGGVLGDIPLVYEEAHFANELLHHIFGLLQLLLELLVLSLLLGVLVH